MVKKNKIVNPMRALAAFMVVFSLLAPISSSWASTPTLGDIVASDDVPVVTPPDPGENDDADLDGIPGVGIPNPDNCARLYNPSQADPDGDGVGAPCDFQPTVYNDDTDNDQRVGTGDNCPSIYNANQRDEDRDGLGDSCDPTPFGWVLGNYAFVQVIGHDQYNTPYRNMGAWYVYDHRWYDANGRLQESLGHLAGSNSIAILVQYGGFARVRYDRDAYTHVPGPCGAAQSDWIPAQPSQRITIDLPLVCTAVRDTGVEIASLDYKHMDYPSGNLIPVPADRTFDGNIVTITGVVENTSQVTKSIAVRFVEEVSQTPPPGCTFQRTLSPGQRSTLECQWNTNGLAWQGGQPRSSRTIRFEVTDGQGTLLDTLTKGIEIRPRPVILVHGWKSDYTTWSSYQSFLSQAHPSWLAFAVGDGQAPGVMETKRNPTKHISENAGEMDRYVFGVQSQFDAWYVDIVGHSMGGLISRYYIHNSMPTYNTNGQTGPSVKNLVMLGTPNMGTPCGKLAMIAGERMPQPATLELTTKFMATFNQDVTNSRGVHFSILAGIAVPSTCYPLLPIYPPYAGHGDLVVAKDSAHAPFVLDRDTTLSLHTQMTKSQNDFTSFVLPRLSSNQVQAPQAGNTKEAPEIPTSSQIDTNTASNTSVNSVEPSHQIIHTASNDLAPNATVDIPVQINSAQSFGVVLLAGGRLNSSLLNPSGTVVDSISAESERAAELIQAYQVENPVPGTWTLRLQNPGSNVVQSDAIFQVAGSPIELSLNLATPSSGGQMQVNASFTNNSAPVVGAGVSAKVREVTGQRQELTTTLYDDGMHSDGSANDGVYGNTVTLPRVGWYSAIVEARTNGEVRTTNDVINYAAPCAIQFTDVTSDSPFYTFVRCLACRNVLGGYSDGTFRPNSNITRGQLSKIVSNAAGFNEAVTGQRFSDVPPSDPFYVYIERMASRGIIGGYSDGTFRPGNNATRGQISKIVANAGNMNEPVSGQRFTDVPPSNPFYEFIERIAARGIIGGYSDGTFRPGNDATRGQVSKIVANTFYPNCNP